MPIVVRLESDALYLQHEENGSLATRTRPLVLADSERISGWVDEYGTVVGLAGAEGRLLGLGRALFGWLDGGERWLTGILDRAPLPFVVAFCVPTRTPDDLQRAFLQLPFELLANEDGYLAQDAGLHYCPLRQLGPPGTPADLDEHCLGLTFMAAAPRGADELDYGAEENAILDATEGLELDLEVEESGNPKELAARLSRNKGMQALHLSCHGENTPKPVLLLETEGGR